MYCMSSFWVSPLCFSLTLRPLIVTHVAVHCCGPSVCYFSVTVAPQDHLGGVVSFALTNCVDRMFLCILGQEFLLSR